MPTTTCMAPSGAIAPATRVEPEEYDLSLTATDRRRYTTNLASFASNLAAAFSSLGIRAQMAANSASVSSDYVAANPMDPPGFTRWTARVTVQSPTTQALLHRAMARAAWHSSTWDQVEAGGVLRDATWTTPPKNAADGGASFVSGMTFGIEPAGRGQAGSNTPGGTAAEQSAARDLNALAQRIALLDGAGRPIVNAEVRRLQLAMGMLPPSAEGRYNEDTQARMRYLGIATPSSSFRAGSAAPAPNTTTGPNTATGPQTAPASTSYVVPMAAVAGVALLGWLATRKGR
jgi:hypothetical protein